MKFKLNYEPGDAVKQYKNLTRWLVQNNIVHGFEWTNTGNYCPDYVIIEDGEDATLFSLTMNHGSKKLQA